MARAWRRLPAGPSSWRSAVTLLYLFLSIACTASVVVVYLAFIETLADLLR